MTSDYISFHTRFYVPRNYAGPIRFLLRSIDGEPVMIHAAEISCFEEFQLGRHLTKLVRVHTFFRSVTVVETRAQIQAILERVEPC